MMTIRIQKDENSKPLQQWLNRIGQLELSPMLSSPNLKWIYTAFYQEELAGMVMAWKNEFHPYCLYFNMIIDPNYYGLHIEDPLLLKLEEQNRSGIPLQTSIWETAVSLKRLYVQHGFEKIRETYMPTLAVAEMDDVIMEEQLVITLRDILGNRLLMEKLTRFVKYTYEQAHLANPAAEIALGKWENMILADDTILDGSFIYLDIQKQEILAYAFLHAGDAADTLELGWCGAIGMQYKEVIPRLVERQIAYANHHQFSFIQGEFDTTDVYAMAVFKAFPFSPCTAWVTYQKKSIHE